MCAFRQLEDAVYQVTKTFQTKHFLLALSGGADSMALFHILCKLQQKKILTFTACTIDHQARENSFHDAKWVYMQCQKANIECEVHTLDKCQDLRNIEEKLRELRFCTLIKQARKKEAKAIFLAHHKNDQIESILKSLFEGGNLMGMQVISKFDGFPILRPFLNIKKALLEKYLIDNHHSWIEDLSNKSSRFTRNRLRHEILPFLQEKFGKQIGNNLLYLSQRLQLMEEYLNTKVENLAKVTELKDGFLVDFSQNKDFNVLELDHYLTCIFKQLNISQNRELRKLFIEHIQKNSIIGPQFFQNREILLDRRRLFFLKKEAKWEAPPNITIGDKKGWLEYLLGESMFLASENAKKMFKKDLPLIQRRFIQSLYAKFQVPVFLQERVPVLFDGKKAYECLTPIKKSEELTSLFHKTMGKKVNFVKLEK